MKKHASKNSKKHPMAATKRLVAAIRLPAANRSRQWLLQLLLKTPVAGRFQASDYQTTIDAGGNLHACVRISKITWRRFIQIDGLKCRPFYGFPQTKTNLTICIGISYNVVPPSYKLAYKPH